MTNIDPPPFGERPTYEAELLSETEQSETRRAVRQLAFPAGAFGFPPATGVSPDTGLTLPASVHFTYVDEQGRGVIENKHSTLD